MNAPKLTLLVLAGLFVVLCGCTSHRSGPYSPTEPARRDTAAAERLTREAAELIASNPTKAEELLREALTADLFHGPAHNNLGVLFLNAGQLYEAAGEFEWARKLMPGHPDPRLNLGLALERGDRRVPHRTGPRARAPTNPSSPDPLPTPPRPPGCRHDHQPRADRNECAPAVAILGSRPVVGRRRNGAVIVYLNPSGRAKVAVINKTQANTHVSCEPIFSAIVRVSNLPNRLCSALDDHLQFAVQNFIDCGCDNLYFRVDFFRCLNPKCITLQHPTGRDDACNFCFVHEWFAFADTPMATMTPERTVRRHSAHCVQVAMSKNNLGVPECERIVTIDDLIIKLVATMKHSRTVSVKNPKTAMAGNDINSMQTRRDQLTCLYIYIGYRVHPSHLG